MPIKLQLPTFFIICYSLLNCATGITAKKLLYRDHRTAYFTLNEKELSPKEREIMGLPYLHPVKMNSKNWKGALGNLRFKKESSVGNMIYYIFSEAELEDLSRNIIPSMERLTNDNILVIISKYNYLKGVVSNDHRTSFAIFKNKEGINIVFREIHSGMHDVDTKNYYEWSNMPGFLFIKNFEVFHVEKEEFFSYKVVNGYENRLWITIDEDSFRILEFVPRKTEEPELETKESIEKSRTKPPEKPAKLPKSEVYIQRDLD